MRKSIRIILLILPILFIFTPTFADILNSHTFRNGGVTLFDDSSAFTVLNNTALLADYGQKPMPLEDIYPDPDFQYNGFVEQQEMPVNPIDAAFNPLGFLPHFYWGRFYAPSVQLAVGASSETVRLMQSSIEAFRGEFSNLGPVIMLTNGLIESTNLTYAELAGWMTAGGLDVAPLFDTNTNLTDSERIQAMTDLLKYNEVGVYQKLTLNLFSLLMYPFGLTGYLDSEMYAGFFGSSRIFPMIPNPEFYGDTESGIACGFVRKNQTLPFIGDTDLGFSLRVFTKIHLEVSDIDEYFDFYDEITNYYENYYLMVLEPASDFSLEWSNVSKVWDFMVKASDYSMLGDGDPVKAGYGGSLSLSATKDLYPYLEAAVKISDILAPVYWQNSDTWGGLTPDLKFGLKLHAPVPFPYSMIVKDPAFVFQMDDLLHLHPRSLTGKLHAGIESKFLFEMIEIGFGINRGYPGGGFSGNFSPYYLMKIPELRPYLKFVPFLSQIHFRWNVLIFGREFSGDPGEMGFQGYQTSFEVYWGF